MKILNISAGGRGERISKYVSSKTNSSTTKHLLPIPVIGKTILGRIIYNGLKTFDQINIWVSAENRHQIYPEFKNLTNVNIYTDDKMTGPLGPMIRSIIENPKRVFGCAGDFYCDFDWKNFEKFHESHNLPISILIAKSVPSPEGARFYSNKKNVITKWERVNKTTKKDKINIGCYIIDPLPNTIRELVLLTKHKEDTFFDKFISQNLVGGYNPHVVGYNINVAEVYEKLISAITSKE